jgi:hypothetical protein
MPAVALVLVMAGAPVVATALVVTGSLVGAAGVVYGLSVLLTGDGRVRTGKQHRDDQTSDYPDSSHGFSSSWREAWLQTGSA